MYYTVGRIMDESKPLSTVHRTITLYHGNRVVQSTSYNSKIVKAWEKRYALHREKNHPILMIITE